jgi:hypothetical protein
LFITVIVIIIIIFIAGKKDNVPKYGHGEARSTTCSSFAATAA